MKITLTFFLLVIFISENIYSSCGSSSCPLHMNNTLEKGLLSLSLTHEYIYQDQIYTGSSKSFVGAIPGHHDEVSTLNQVTAFSMVYAASDYFRINLSLPFIHREHSHVHNHHGEQIWQYWNFSGIGDAAITANVSLLKTDDNSVSFEIMGGMKLSTGVTDIRNQNGEEAEVTIQPGSGSTDLIFGASVFKDILSVPDLPGSSYSVLPLVLSGSYKYNTKGTNDYKFGNELLLHLSTAYRLAEKISFLLQVNGRFTNKSDAGLTGEPEENTGGKWLFVSPGLELSLGEYFKLYGYIQLPVYQNVNGIQQASSYNLKVGLSNEISIFN